MPTGSTPGPCLAEDGVEGLFLEFQKSFYFRIFILFQKACARRLHPTHESEVVFRQGEQLVLARRTETAQAKGEYDELVYELDITED